MTLRESTRDQHHSAEKTLVGAAMASGDISEQWWADWMGAILQIHMRIDPGLPECLRRTLPLTQDLHSLGVQPRFSEFSHHYVGTLTDQIAVDAATYVFTGAHLMGGAMTYKALNGRLPARHLEWESRSEAVRLWKPLRERQELTSAAREAFGYVVSICNEIAAHDTK